MITCMGISSRKRGRPETHGFSKERLYKIWFDMNRRCYKPNTFGYKHYGGRGITVCKQWSDFTSFKTWAIDAGYLPTLSIERLDVNKGYSPTNCKWIPRREQPKNTRRTIQYNGETAREASLRLSNTSTLVWQRVKFLGWPLEKAFTKPVR
jgi:hypothetical protein